MGETVKYIHHGKKVSVRAVLKGMHKKYGLCYECKRFLPKLACPCHAAELLTHLNGLISVLTVVWECPDFEPADEI